MNVIKATTPVEFVRLVPNMLGAMPRESLVVVPMRGSQSVGAMRVDLTYQMDIPTWADQVAEIVVRVEGVTGAFIVLYTDDIAPTAGDYSDGMGMALAGYGIEMIDAVLVTSTYWESLQSGDTGDAFEVLPTNMPEAQIAGSHDDLRLPAPLVGVKMRELSDLEIAHAIDIDLTPIELNEHLLFARNLTDLRYSLLLTYLNRPSFRDVLLLQAFGGEEMGLRAWEAQNAWEYGEDYPEDLGLVVFGKHETRPDPECLERAMDRALEVAVTGDCAGAFVFAAWISWALGRSTQADLLLDRASEIDPSVSMIDLLRTMIHAGHLPEWAFSA